MHYCIEYKYTNIWKYKNIKDRNMSHSLWVDKPFELCLSRSVGRGREIFKKLQHHLSSIKAVASTLLHLQASTSPPGKDDVSDSSVVCSKDTPWDTSGWHCSKGQDNWPVPRFNGFIHCRSAPLEFSRLIIKRAQPRYPWLHEKIRDRNMAVSAWNKTSNS